jgi:hypothetical protein
MQPEVLDMDDPADHTHETDSRHASAPRIAGHRYPTPTGDPCPRTVRVDGTIELGGNCMSCGTCLLFGHLLDPTDPRPPTGSAGPNG